MSTQQPPTGPAPSEPAIRGSAPSDAAPSGPGRPEPASVPAGSSVPAEVSGAGAAVVAAFEAIGAGLELLAGLDAHAPPGDVPHEAVRGLEVADRRLAGIRAHL